MEEILQHIQEVLGVPEFLINHCTFLPDWIKDALRTSINFIPWLYFLYYAIELLERFFLKRIHLLVKLMKRLGSLFGIAISIIPECGYSVIASTFYTRRLISRGTLLAFLIVCSDDALPLLFMDLSKAIVIIPIIVIKIVVAIAVSILVDLAFIFEKNSTENINAINTDLNEPACCHHRIVSSEQDPPYWWMHPLTHTFNMFMFTFLSLAVLNCVIQSFGSAEAVAAFIRIDTPYQVIGAAIFGIIPNCAVSVILAMAYIKGVLSFPAFLAGMITTAGLGLAVLYKRSQHNADNNFITILLLLTGIATGLVVFYNMHLIDYIQNLFG